MKKILLNIAACSLFTIALNSCSKDKTPQYDNSNKGTITVEFDNVAGDENLVLGTGEYTNASGEKYKVDILRYYVSNFSFKDKEGKEYIVPKDSCYFAIDESDPAYKYATLSVPEGEYTEISFIVGVDSAKSSVDVSERKGVLDPTTEIGRDMWWGWAQGYIFFKMEGTSPASGIADNKITYHIGGFGYNSAPNNTRKVTLDLKAGGTAKVLASKKSNIHLMVDINKIYDENITITGMPSVMSGLKTTQIADRFVHMFRHDHTEN